jgi:hypothetical protein
MEVHPQAQNDRMVSFFFYIFFIFFVHIHDRINNEIHPSRCVIKPSFLTQVWNEKKNKKRSSGGMQPAEYETRVIIVDGNEYLGERQMAS